MIVSRIQGGLGNQMFQYAFGLYLAERNATELFLECASVDRDPLRHFALDCWSIDAPLVSDSVLRLLPHRYKGKGWLNLLRGKFPLRRVREKPFGFHAKYLTVGDHVFLDGYWQSEQFFPQFRERLQAVFQPSRPVCGQSTTIAHRIEKVPAVSLHIRRGDYVQNQATFKTHGVCPLEYYHSCVADLLARHEKIELFVFSDDPAWCRGNLQLKCPTVYVDHNNANAAHEDLWLMTRCRHHIVANSSFSWWGAWLRLNETGTVYAPERWFSNTKFDASAIVPSTWRKMAVVESFKQQVA